MKKARMQSAFTLVELLVVVALLAILSGAAYVGIQRSQTRVMNEKMMDDLQAISNALEQFKQDAGHYPNITEGDLVLGEDGGTTNISCFFSDTSYAHDCDTADFIQAMVDNAVLTKRYLQEVPTDPRTGSRYVYGVSADGQYYQVAGNYLNDDGTSTARSVGNLKKGSELASLIRAYDGPNFVTDLGDYLPYSPDHLSITARLEDIQGTVTVDGTPVISATTVNPDTLIETAEGGSVVIYFSDGSVTYLDPESKLRILPNTEVTENDKDGIVTKIRLKLFQGKIWNKVARLASQSEFNVETTSAIAGVRGTEFGIDATVPNSPTITVLSGKVVSEMKETLESPGIVNENFEEFSSLPDTGVFAEDKIIIGDGINFKTYTIPEKDQQQSGDSIPEDAPTFQDRYYRGILQDSFAPRILRVNIPNEYELVLQKPTPPLASMVKYPFVVNVIVDGFDKNGFNQTFTSQAFGINDTEKTITLNPDIVENLIAMLSDSPEFNRVRFRFEMSDGNMTGYSDPAIILRENTILTAADIYNDAFQDYGQNTQIPNINVPLSIVKVPQDALLGGNFQLQANKPCDWSITKGGGTLEGILIESTLVNYKSITNQDPLEIMNEVGDRFGSESVEQIGIKCDDENEVDEDSFVLNYAPFKTSSIPPDGSGYKYSYFADLADWNTANTDCNNLSEGGRSWELPVKGDNNSGLDIADGALNNNETSIKEVSLMCANNGQTCINPPLTGTGQFWQGTATGNNAFQLGIFNRRIGFSGSQNELHGYRCVCKTNC